MSVAFTPFPLTLPSISTSTHSRTFVVTPYRTRNIRITIKCVKVEDADTESSEATIMCEACNGRGWVVCDFCEGQKTNVRAQNNRIYRRCPSCKAVGYVLCAKCKVFKCVTFPDFNDSQIS
ncbi:uncharacterized protein LOC131593621 [Vicia villosa]|uniref:uncharacterized protein LOC131593621 n=1 Tax=Vicia villosa TaxID=3911 RepID=UPI00273C76E3|nr:uncharacterized protein LOC131593621 [Vicia villosa]